MNQPVLTPSIILTPRAFAEARAIEIIGIEPDIAAMQAIQNLPGIPQEFLPDTTVFRWGDRHDPLFARAPLDAGYFPSTELAAQDRDPQAITAEYARNTLLASRKILELTVMDWQTDLLGRTLANAMFNTKKNAAGIGFQVAQSFLEAFNWLGRASTGDLNADHPAAQRARAIHPYRISRQR